MKTKKLGILAIAMLLIGIALATMPAEAKTYYTTDSGNATVRYNHNEISSSFQPFVDYI